MSETTLTQEDRVALCASLSLAADTLAKGRTPYIGIEPHELRAAAVALDALAAQLTEVTRQRDAIKATYDEFCAKFPSKSVMRRQAAMRDPADPSAPTPR